MYAGRRVETGDDPVERGDGTCWGGGKEGVWVAAPGGGVGGAGGGLAEEVGC